VIRELVMAQTRRHSAGKRPAVPVAEAAQHGIGVTRIARHGKAHTIGNCELASIVHRGSSDFLQQELRTTLPQQEYDNMLLLQSTDGLCRK